MFTRLDLRGARALLTGASSGLGWSLALQLADRGVRLVLASRDRGRLEELASLVRQRGAEAVVVPTDVTDSSQRIRLIDSAVSAHGGVDVLINNAGFGAMGFFADASEERLRRIFEVNFFGATELTRLALPYLGNGRNPMIVNVSSVIGRRAIPGCTEYCASKFALTGWSEGLRAELKAQGIHVLLVCPGLIETNFKRNLLEDKVRFAWQKHRAMSADRCAQLIVWAMRRKKKELVTTAEGKMMLWMNRLFPRAVDFILARYSRNPMVQKADNP